MTTAGYIAKVFYILVQRYCSSVFFTSLVTIPRKWNQPRCPSIDWKMDNADMAFIHNGMFLIYKKAAGGRYWYFYSSVNPRKSMPTCQASFASPRNSGTTLMQKTWPSEVLRLILQKGIHAWYYKPSRKPIAWDLLGPKGKMSVVLLSWHGIKISSKHLFTSIDKCDSQPWPENLLSAIIVVNTKAHGVLTIYIIPAKAQGIPWRRGGKEMEKWL